MKEQHRERGGRGGEGSALVFFLCGARCPTMVCLICLALCLFVLRYNKKFGHACCLQQTHKKDPSFDRPKKNRGTNKTQGWPLLVKQRLDRKQQHRS